MKPIRYISLIRAVTITLLLLLGIWALMYHGGNLIHGVLMPLAILP